MESFAFACVLIKSWHCCMAFFIYTFLALFASCPVCINVTGTVGTITNPQPVSNNIITIYKATDYDLNIFMNTAHIKSKSNKKYNILSYLMGISDSSATSMLPHNKTKYIPSCILLSNSIIIHTITKNINANIATVDDNNKKKRDETFAAPSSATIIPISKIIPFCKPTVFRPIEAQSQIPCAQVSLFDCFSEGGELFPYDNYLSMTFFGTLISANLYTYTRSSFEGLDLETLDDTIGLSCPTFMGTRLPYNYLYDGETRADPETVVFMDSIYGLAKKIKIDTRQCTYYTVTYSCEITDSDSDEAKELYWKWLADVVDWSLNHDENKNSKIKVWNDRAGPDLLAGASSADFVLICVSYFAMIIFAALTELPPNNLFLSPSEASFFAVVLVVLSVAATMGLTGSFVKSAQFIAIGFGVDAETVRIAGSSVALTSIANFLVFGTIVAVLNFMSAIFAFTAVLVLKSRRQKSGYYRDWLFMCCSDECTKYEPETNPLEARSPSASDANMLSQPTPSGATQTNNNHDTFEPFHNILIKTSIRVYYLLICIILFALGCGGINQTEVGLPLQEIGQKDSYAVDFLVVCVKYYATQSLFILSIRISKIFTRN